MEVSVADAQEYVVLGQKEKERPTNSVVKYCYLMLFRKIWRQVKLCFYFSQL